ncbi:MAG: SGNH/GDSL hydrolase family protein [Sediminibacterium sp.]
MKKYILLALCIWFFASCVKSGGADVNIIIPNSYNSFTDSVHYLALGDSYTIGTSIDVVDGYPNQTFQLLKGAGIKMSSLQIIAKNGWTVEDLKNGLANSDKKSSYQVVTILIGVNNQFQGRAMSEFESGFLSLLKSAIALVGNKPKRVFVLSIPDWGITPFASGRDRKVIEDEINNYNIVCENYAKTYGANFINITDAYRVDGFKTDYLSVDGLHPSKLEYNKWAIKLTQQIVNVFSAGG